MEKDRRKASILATLCLLAAITAIAIGTYAWFSPIIQGNDRASNIYVSAFDGDNITFHNGNEINITDFMPNQYVEKTFTLLITDNTITIPYNVYIDIYENTFIQTYSNELTYSLTSTYDGLGTPVADTSGEITPNIPSSSTATSITLGNGVLSSGGDSITYILRISFNEMSANQNSNLSKSLSAKIRVSSTLTSDD